MTGSRPTAANAGNIDADDTLRLRGVIERHGYLGRNTDEIEVSEMIVLVYNVPKERQDLFLQGVAMVGQTTPGKARDRMIIGSRRESIDRVERFIKAGITHFIFLRTAPLIVGDEIQVFAEEVVPKFRQ